MLAGLVGEVAAALVHALRVVISPVEEEAVLPLGRVLGEPLGGTGDARVVVLAADLHGEQARRGRGEDLFAAAGLVGEAGDLVDRVALRVELRAVGLAEVVDGLLDGVGGDVEAGVLGRAQRHRLPDGDGEVGVAGVGGVAPAALPGRVLLDLLGLEDELDGLLGLLAGELVLFDVEAHAEHLGEHQRGDAVAVHPRPVLEAEVALRVLVVVLEDEGQGGAHRAALGGRVGGLMADGGHGHDRQRGHGDAVGVAAVVDEVLVLVLLRDDVVDGALHGVVDLVLLEGGGGGRGVGRPFLRRVGGGGKERKGERQGEETRDLSRTQGRAWGAGVIFSVSERVHCLLLFSRAFSAMTRK